MPSITEPIIPFSPEKIPSIPFAVRSVSPVKIPAKKSINPCRASFTPLISSCPCPVDVVMLRSRAAIIAISKGIQEPINIPIPTPAARIPAIASIWFWKFHPFFSASENATASTARPETIAVIPPATGPRATYSPVTASVIPKIMPVMFSSVTPFTIASRMFCTSVSAPKIPTAKPMVFCKSRPSFGPSFHAANPALMARIHGSAFLSFCVTSSICLLTASPIKSYSGNSKSKPLPPDTPAEPDPDAVLPFRMLSSSKPITDFFSSFAALVASSRPAAVSSAPLARFFTPEVSMSDNSNPNNLAIASASFRIALAIAMAIGKSFIKIGIKILPIDLAVISICALKMRNWLAGASKVRAMSPCAVVTCVIMA